MNDIKRSQNLTFSDRASSNTVETSYFGVNKGGLFISVACGQDFS